MEKKKSVHIPQRMCIGCRKMVNKPELIRVVIADGEIKLDKTHKMNGRGTYICKNSECILAAQKKKALQRQFKRQVSEELYKELTAYVS